MSRFPDRKKALAVLAAVSAVGVAAAACAGGGSGGKPQAAGTRPSSSASSSGTSGATGGADGSSGTSGHAGTGSATPGGPSGSSNGPSSGGTTGSSGGTTSPSGSSSSSGGPSPTAVIPTTPGYQPPATPRKNAGVDCSTAKCIALTFDDGPGPDTGRLLDLLQRENVPATFFVLGDQAEKYPATVRREYAEGHEVGNHTYDHKDLSTLSAAAVQAEIKHGADAIAATGIPRPTLVRPPYGAVNDTVRTYAGYPFIMWRVDPLDWKYPNAVRVADQIVSHAQPGRIVLSHDIHKTTIDAMPAVIQRLKQQGYTFVTVSTLLKGVNLQNGQSYFTRPAAMTGTGGGSVQAPQYSQTPQGPQPPQGPQGPPSGPVGGADPGVPNGKQSGGTGGPSQH
ncbi:polysaccharide deacetylase family protein [Catenulispora subtropica]|uniref:NodB homology domain-containing protein n=1 Tax=Catenulispora subtropica TaxID=450798 RepID=A0ABP5D7D1_9ACTN